MLGLYLVPRIKACRRVITSLGGIADFFQSWLRNEASLGMIVNGPEEALRAVREQVPLSNFLAFRL